MYVETFVKLYDGRTGALMITTHVPTDDCEEAIKCARRKLTGMLLGLIHHKEQTMQSGSKLIGDKWYDYTDHWYAFEETQKNRDEVYDEILPNLHVETKVIITSDDLLS